MQTVSADDDNQIKWSAIPLTLQHFLDKRSDYKSKINDIMFNMPIEASQKFDGTNVGKDTNGLMYGRNKMIPFNAGSYQKTNIDFVKKMDVNPIRDELNEVCGVDLRNFVLYGELMCNSSLYNYKEFETFNVFGAMIKPDDDQSPKEICEKLQAQGFATNCGEEGSNKFMLVMNQAFKALIDKHGLPTVPFLGKFENFYSLVMANYDWMVNGKGEGLVLVHSGMISKWKIGAEANQSNLDSLRTIIDEIEDDKENTIFGENTEKAIDLFNKFYAIQKSNLVMGEAPKPKGKEVKAPKAKPQKVVLSPEMTAQYDEAIKSAKSKFDHADTYFAKNMKGVEEFSKLIAAECLNDIKAENLDEHNSIIKDIIKGEFVEYNKAKKGKK